MKFSIITTALNSEKSIKKSFLSIDKQNFDKKKINWYLLDGGSTDQTVKIAKSLKSKVAKRVLSKKDNGLYYGYNNGIRLVKNQKNKIINFLDSDNVLANNNVFNTVFNIFKRYDVDIVFSDLVYVNKNDEIMRYWSSLPRKKFDFKHNNIYFYNGFNFKDHFFGWSIALPTIFIKSNLLRKIGSFNTNYSICSDYEWTLRLSNIKNLKAAYIPKVLIKMKTGGVSNKFKNILIIKFQDLKILLKNNKRHGIILSIFYSVTTLIFKNLRKLPQFFNKNT